MKLTCRTTFIFLIIIFNSFHANAQERDMVKEHQYEEKLRTIDPSLVPIFKSATVALDSLNYSLADSLYTIIFKRDSTFEPAVRRLGTIKTQLGHIDEGIALCERAVAINRSAVNVYMLAGCLFSSGGSESTASTENLTRALGLLKEGRNLPEADDYEFTVLIGQISLQLNLINNFKVESKSLLEKHADKMVSHYFAAISASVDEEWTTAEKEILIAKSMGLDEVTVNAFLNSGVSTKAATSYYKNLFLWILCFWGAGFILLYIFGLLLSNYTLRSVEREFVGNSTNNSSRTLRKIYRVLINVAGLYYYISLPIILVLVFAVVVGIFYLFIMIGRIPIQLMAILVIGGIITIYSMIRSLLLRVNDSDPGHELKEEDAPALFALTREVASTMGTRAIDEIRITPEVDLAVYERGSWKEKFRDKGKRILILGTGVIKDFKQNDFRAVLAHEYGHFSHRDTAGGSVALQVRRDMHKYIFALYSNGQTVWWNLAFQFLRLYEFIFRRISNGATRLQEILADRVAAQTYGANSFKNGLSYVIKRNIEFVSLAKIEIEDARKVDRPFNNLYELSGAANETIEIEFNKSINRKTTNDDTHPSPVDRFRYIEGLGIGKSGEDTVYVRDLFRDWNKLTAEMTKEIEDGWMKSKR